MGLASGIQTAVKVRAQRALPLRPSARYRDAWDAAASAASYWLFSNPTSTMSPTRVTGTTLASVSCRISCMYLLCLRTFRSSTLTPFAERKRRAWAQCGQSGTTYMTMSVALTSQPWSLPPCRPSALREARRVVHTDYAQLGHTAQFTWTVVVISLRKARRAVWTAVGRSWSIMWPAFATGT